MIILKQDFNFILKTPHLEDVCLEKEDSPGNHWPAQGTPSTQ
jgi:hypothetical protein